MAPCQESCIEKLEFENKILTAKVAQLQAEAVYLEKILAVHKMRACRDSAAETVGESTAFE